MKRLLLIIAALLLTVFAAAQVQAVGLEITDMSVEVDDDLENSVDATGGDFEVPPGGEVELDIEVSNTHPDNAVNHEIQNIEIEVEIEAVCDDSYDDEQVFNDDFKDLDPGDDDNLLIRFQVPKCANEGDYDIDITVEGEDDDGTDYKIKETIRMTVDRQGHELDFYDVVLTPSTVSCDRDFTGAVEVHNIGALDEDTGLLIKNEEIKLLKFIPFDLKTQKDYFDETSYYKDEAIPLSIGSDVAPGKYLIKFEVEIGPQNTEVLQYPELEVKACVPETEQVAEPVQQAEPAEENSGSIVEQTEEEETPTQVAPVVQPQVPVQPVQQPVTPITDKAEEKSTINDLFKDNQTLVILIGVAVAVLLLVAVVGLLYVLLRK